MKIGFMGVVLVICGSVMGAPIDAAKGEPSVYIVPDNVTTTAVIPTIYGETRSGELSYTLSSVQTQAWTWLEVSLDGGATWSPGKVQAIGHIGTVRTGPNRKVHWLLDLRAQDQAAFRIRSTSTPGSTVSTRPRRSKR